MKFDPNQTWVSVSVIIASFISITGAIVWCTATYSAQIHFNSSVLTKLTELKQSVDRLNIDGVSTKRFDQWVELFKAKNANLNVPDLPK